MNHHFGNVGDVMKHLALVCVAERVHAARYLESHAGAFDYSLADRDGRLPGGVWDFIAAAPSVGALTQSGYGALLGRISGTHAAPGVYPGSARCVWEVRDNDVEYVVNDVDTEALESLRAELTSRGASAFLSSDDGLDMVVTEARAGDLVLIDPFRPEQRSPAHGVNTLEAAQIAAGRGAMVLVWRPLHRKDTAAAAAPWAGLRIALEFLEPTGSMDGCDLTLANLPVDTAAEVARLSTALSGVLKNTRLSISAPSG